MPIPTPTPSEKKDTVGKKLFIQRCMSDLNKDYPNNKQRFAICLKSYQDSKRKSSGKFDYLENDKIEILD